MDRLLNGVRMTGKKSFTEMDHNFPSPLGKNTKDTHYTHA